MPRATEAGERPRPLVSREFVLAERRRRVAMAVAVGSHERGLRAQTAGVIVARTRMARNTFYELFDSRDGAIAYSCEAATRVVVEPVATAGAEGGSRRERAERTVDALIETVDAEPFLAELCLVHSPEAAVAEPHRFTSEVVDATWQALGGTLRDELAANAIVMLVTMQIARGGAARLGDLRAGMVAIAAE